jgi:hypothetical protein
MARETWVELQCIKWNNTGTRNWKHVSTSSEGNMTKHTSDFNKAINRNIEGMSSGKTE